MEARATPLPTRASEFHDCTPLQLPSGGLVEIAPDYTITLTQIATFVPSCHSGNPHDVEALPGVNSMADIKEPFHASIMPQAYATGAATVVAWMLVIMLIITPRTFFVGGASSRSGLLGRRGMISGATGGGSIIGVGTRPWLQKVAALTVAVSLTLATADTFKIGQRQYEDGFMDAMKLRDQVVSGMEIKVSRVISDIFLWLAQVQTLIRLFPRHKEKVIIKWVGFALILLDITFTSLNSFGPYNDNRRPRHFETAIPALSYLFQLSLSMLYAAWVLYYAITKRRYAFYHSMMWNMSVVALVSIIAILTPVVFFITDISDYTIAGWGDYFRWVGAAAASVIVWEWVERIEALEREERKDGILGREIYDGDEMLDDTPSQEAAWPRSKHLSDDTKKPKDGGSGGGAFTSGALGHGLSNIAHRFGRSKQEQVRESTKARRTIHIPAPQPAHRRSNSAHRSPRNSRAFEEIQGPPPAVASPVSRTDTTSADSTVYTIRYHPISVSPPNHVDPASQNRLRRTFSDRGTELLHNSTSSSEDPEKAIEVTEENDLAQAKSKWNWYNPFNRRGRSPPPEVLAGRVIEPLSVEDVTANVPPRNYTGLALKDRLGTFAAQQGERFRTKKNAGQQSEQNLPVTIIPAQPRGRTWSPEILNQQRDAQGEQQTEQETEVSASTGMQFDHTPPRSVPPVNDGTLGRPMPSGSASHDNTEAGFDESASSSERASHVRFTPDSFQRPGERQPSGTASRIPSRTPSSVGFGPELRQTPPHSTPSPYNRQPPASGNLNSIQQTPTNHDR
ncbi:PalH-domain-containing protein [Aaosphaeria arxii CBS 175.79]|uniref:PalH-domain-containing protein n=1 Tax=Aaosphaeria arxii CBS 175.79 TaxID=1450172 RepID=A0A6A5XEH1_9PLEO|nr:PalH-domain-containing protein [Aaosphaeria arxii CBS 175.79]KAF2011462.1 PalH-domain-containing protein [Aaosphaeria arxii CBS 175.79]